MQNNTGTKQKNTEWLCKAANTRGVLNADQYSAESKRKSMAASETAYSMSRYLISISTYLTSAKRVRTFQPNLVEYECDPPCLRYHVIYDIITSAKTNLKVMSDRFNSSICKYFDVDEICFCGLVEETAALMIVV